VAAWSGTTAIPGGLRGTLTVTSYNVGQPPATPPPYQPLPPPKKKSKLPLILGILGAVIVLCCGGGIIAFALSGGDNPPTTSSSQGSSKQAATIGQAVRDGQFEFTVTKVQCGVPKVGDSIMEKKAQGQYCLITVTVKNIGKEPRTLSDSSQRAFDAAGREFSTDEAGMYVPNNDTVFINNINPGNSVTGVLVFDVPKDGKLVKLELHDSPLSGGIEVSLAA
jgi:hypothetical protein